MQYVALLVFPACIQFSSHSTPNLCQLQLPFSSVCMEKHAVFGVVRFCGVGTSCMVLDITITSCVYTTNGGDVGLAFTTYRAKKFSIAVAVSSGESSCTACPVFGSNAS